MTNKPKDEQDKRTIRTECNFSPAEYERISNARAVEAPSLSLPAYIRFVLEKHIATVDTSRLAMAGKTYYYYHKDKYGREVCYALDGSEIAGECRDALEECGNGMQAESDTAVTTIYAEGLEDAGEDEREAIYEAFANGFALPLAMVRIGGDYEAKPLTAVDYYEVWRNYIDSGYYRIEPDYYEEGSITPAQAEKRGMYALAATMRANKDEE